MNLSGPLSAISGYGQRLQTATCVISRPGEGDPVFDPETGGYTDPPAQTIYSGNCLVVPTGGDRVQEFGEGPVVTRNYDITLDGLTDAVHVGDTVIVASAADDRLDGMELTVLDVVSSSLPTNRRIVAEEVL